jgi:hypothetical protein
MKQRLTVLSILLATAHIADFIPPEKPSLLARADCTFR